MKRSIVVVLGLVLIGCGATAPEYVAPGQGDASSGSDGSTSADGATTSVDSASQADADPMEDSAAVQDTSESSDSTQGASDVTDKQDVQVPEDAAADASTDGDADAGEDSGISDTTAAPDTTVVDSGGWASTDTGPKEDIPWGSSADALSFDSGPTNYGDVQNTSGNTGSGGAGLCIPKISQLNLEKIKVGGKVDIIIFVDTSGSMGQEAKYVSQNLNNFGAYLAGKALDYRVVLLGKDTGCCKLQIQPPLVNNPAVYKHVKKAVYSWDGLKRVIDYYPDYQNFLRADATTNFLAITDDESKPMTSAQWEQQIAGLQNPGFGPGWVFHSIVAYGPMPSKGCSTGAKIGQQYLNLTAKSGGVKKPVCDNNWSQIFNDIAKGVVKTAKPPCTHQIPLPAGVKSAKGVTVNYVAEDDFFNVPPAQGNICPGNGAGYTLDNPNDPKKITLCNKSCDLLKGGGNIQFDFGCFL
ncbi:MAG: hypothetical protein CMH53_06635 [Myxococcales bacterium]|nr:hypothetical protein [Myxococcales bacterium]